MPAAAPPYGLGYTFGPELALALHIAEAHPTRRLTLAPALALALTPTITLTIT